MGPILQTNLANSVSFCGYIFTFQHNEKAGLFQTKVCVFYVSPVTLMCLFDPGTGGGTFVSERLLETLL